MKIQGFIEPPRLEPELEHEPNSTLTPKLLINYIGKVLDLFLLVCLNLNQGYELGFQDGSREGVQGYIYRG